MARLLLPTRNRPTALNNVLNYLDQFYPDCEVIVADGSNDAHKDEVRATATANRSIAVDFRPYPFDFPFFDRILDVLTNETDPFFVMGADDDYPMMEVFQREEKFLRENSDYVSVMGPTVHLSYDGGTEMKTRMSVARPIKASRAETRAVHYSKWPFSTTYSISRRQALITRYQRSRMLFLAGFYDYGVGIQDSFQGKIRAVSDLGYLRTHNSNHSYLRAESTMIFAHRAQDLLTYTSNMQADFVEYAGLDEDSAKHQAEVIVRKFVAEYCGRRAQNMNGFGQSRVGTNPVVVAQVAMFGDMFTPGTKARDRYEDRLMFIARALRGNFTSNDNDGEDSFYETLDKQAKGEAK